MTHRTHSLAALCLLITGGLTAQERTAPFHPPAWGLKDPASIRLGQISLSHDPRGDRLNIQALYPEGFFAQSPLIDTKDGCLEIADFRHAFVNNLGGSYAVFESSPGSVTLTHVMPPIPTSALVLKYTAKSVGFRGFWMQFFNSKAPPEERTYFDATRFASLQITVRGTRGSERLLLKIADAAWNEKEDALPVGELSAFLPLGRVDTAWQTAVIPVSALPAALEPSRLASIAVEVLDGTSGEVEFSRVAFCATLDKHKTHPDPFSPSDPPERAIWVWNTTDLRAPAALDDLKKFLRAESIRHVFLALPYDASLPESSGGVPINAAEIAPIVRALNADGRLVHALTGDKDFIRPDKRSFVRTTVQNVLDYQRAVPPTDRFHGLHLDIEPYLLPGFNSTRQVWFLEHLLEALSLCADLARAGGLTVGADIPPWLDAPNEITNRPMEILWRGKRATPDRHIIDLMDFVVLMDYRTKAQGEDGAAFQALNELLYAGRTGKRVFVGLETVPLNDETLFLFQGQPQRGLPPPAVGHAAIIASAGDTLAMVLSPETRAEFHTWAQTNNVPAGNLLWWPIRRTSRIAASRISFAGGVGLAALQQTMEEAEAILRAIPSFAGFAIHDYQGYRILVEGRDRQR